MSACTTITCIQCLPSKGGEDAEQITTQRDGRLGAIECAAAIG